MKDENSKIWVGKYFGYPINKIPLDYLFWLFPKLKRTKRDTAFYYGILRYFLTKYISVVDRTREGEGYCFYFDTFKKYTPSGEEIPFLKADWRAKDSTGNYVYEVSHLEQKHYIHRVNEKWDINYNIVYHNYYFGGYPMVYEKNPEYYFYDGYGKIINGAYLLRRPWIPDASIADSFSGNIKIGKDE